MNEFIAGAIAGCCWAIGVIFIQFFRRTGDPFFARFAIAFWFLAAERVGMLVIDARDEAYGWLFLLRLSAFVLILVAIAGKNLVPTGSPMRVRRRRASNDAS